jgi:hypothetical protein
MILGNGHPFVQGDVVRAFPRDAWSGPLPDGEPEGEPVAETTVDRDGVCELDVPTGEFVALTDRIPTFRVRFRA